MNRPNLEKMVTFYRRRENVTEKSETTRFADCQLLRYQFVLIKKMKGILNEKTMFTTAA